MKASLSGCQRGFQFLHGLDFDLPDTLGGDAVAQCQAVTASHVDSHVTVNADDAGVADAGDDNRSAGYPGCDDGPAMTGTLCLTDGVPTGALGGSSLILGGTSGD